jgi:hypothetical protein
MLRMGDDTDADAADAADQLPPWQPADTEGGPPDAEVSDCSYCSACGGRS